MATTISPVTGFKIPRTPTASQYNLPQNYVIPANTTGRVSQSEINAYTVGTINNISDIQSQYATVGSASGAADAAQRKAIQDRLKFGLRGIGLDRKESGYNRRDAIESAINNALQRGIYNSGIRVRNVNRAGERSDLADARINLGEDELRASIKNALASLNASAKANRVARDLEMNRQIEEYNQYRRDQLAQTVLEHGGVYNDTTYHEIGKPWGIS